MIRASDLIGCELRTASGERLGRVHDLRAEQTDGSWHLMGLVVGRRGLSARLIGTGPDPTVSGSLILWEAVSRLEAGTVIVRDGTAATRSTTARSDAESSE